MQIMHEKKQAIYGSETKMQQKKYNKPELKQLGDLRTLTLGVSPSGYQDSDGVLYSSTILPTPGIPGIPGE